MAAFDELDFRRLDVQAMVSYAGLATIAVEDHSEYRAWLAAEGYSVDEIDCSQGLEPALRAFGRLMRWQERFGYVLDGDSRNLDALCDGFSFDAPPPGGRVLEFYRPDIAWKEDPRFMPGWLAIASCHAREQLALGRRFFTACILPDDSRLIGQPIDHVCLPAAWRLLRRQ